MERELVFHPSVLFRFSANLDESLKIASRYVHSYFQISANSIDIYSLKQHIQGTSKIANKQYLSY